MDKALATAEGWDLELPFNHPDGRPLWLRMVGAVEVADGRMVRLHGAIQDVTDLREMSARMAQEHELLRVTLRSIGDAVITTDAKGRIAWLNPVAERMTGWVSDDAQGLPLERVFYIVHEQTRQPAPNPVADCLRRGEVVSLASQTVLITRRHGVRH
jgi:PAS domain S-box-containing protein